MMNLLRRLTPSPMMNILMPLTATAGEDREGGRGGWRLGRILWRPVLLWVGTQAQKPPARTSSVYADWQGQHARRPLRRGTATTTAATTSQSRAPSAIAAPRSRCSPAANRKLVAPPSTQSGMLSTRPPNFPISPNSSSQAAAAQPAHLEATPVREMTPLFCSSTAATASAPRRQHCDTSRGLQRQLCYSTQTLAHDVPARVRVRQAVDTPRNSGTTPRGVVVCTLRAPPCQQHSTPT